MRDVFYANRKGPIPKTLSEVAACLRRSWWQVIRHPGGEETVEVDFLADHGPEIASQMNLRSA